MTTEMKTYQQQPGGKAQPQQPADPYKWVAYWFLFMLMVTLPILMGVLLLYRPAPELTPIQRVAARFDVNPQALYAGRTTYAMSCAVCHGQSGEGVLKLGKPLKNNPLIQSLNDEQLSGLIAQGRAVSDPDNTSGVAMPPRGGTTLPSKKLGYIVAFLRTIQDPAAPPSSMEAWDLEAALGKENPLLVGELGHDAFISTCAQCHGKGGLGLPDLGKPLATSDFVASQSDDELLEFIQEGRAIWDDENTTGVEMPPRGGNDDLTDEQLLEVINYIRALHASKAEQDS